MAKLTGGGIQSNKYVTSKAGQKVEPIAKKASPAGAAQQGMAVQFEKKPLVEGRGYEPKPMPSTGIAKATFNPASQGPGSGRTVYRSGSQSGTPAPKDMEKGVDILSQFGPEATGKR